MLPELKAGVWIDALIRRAQSAGAFAYLSCRGDRDAGSLLVLVRGPDMLTLFAPERDMTGQRIWRGTSLNEDDAEARIESRLNFDPDLNVVEIEDRDNRHFIDERVMPLAESQGDEAAALDAARALFRDR